MMNVLLKMKRQKWLVELNCALLLAGGFSSIVLAQNTDRGAIHIRGKQTKAALVIGNADYAGAPLVNPVNDARAVRDVLTKLGFAVEYLENGTKRGMEEAVDNFSESLEKGGVAVCFFAGHGLQVKNENYLQPLKAKLKTEGDVRYECVSASWVLNKMGEANTGVNLLMLDACRNNPFGRGMRGRSVAGGGLATMNAPAGTLIAFATAPGTLAKDGVGAKNSPFTSAWLAEVGRPQSVETLFKRVRQRVHTATAKEQTPWLVSSLIGEFAFVNQGAADDLTLKTPTIPDAESPDPSDAGPPAGSFAGTRAGQTRKDNSLGLSLAWCPPGEFTMGSPADEPNRADDEAQVRVQLDGFWLGAYEVTQAQWRTVMGTDPSKFKGADLPVEQVSWPNTVAFCEKLTETERAAGRLPVDWEYRLPSEAQWEYGCRAGTTTATSFGKNLSLTQANFVAFGRAGAKASVGEPTPVGSYPANAWGLYDMHGNVWEWCQDEYKKQLPGGRNPLVTVGDSRSRVLRVYRGGTWAKWNTNCRSPKRQMDSQGYYRHDLGFRVAAVPLTRKSKRPANEEN